MHYQCLSAGDQMSITGAAESVGPLRGDCVCPGLLGGFKGALNRATRCQILGGGAERIWTDTARKRTWSTEMTLPFWLYQYDSGRRILTCRRAKAVRLGLQCPWALLTVRTCVLMRHCAVPHTLCCAAGIVGHKQELQDARAADSFQKLRRIDVDRAGF